MRGIVIIVISVLLPMLSCCASGGLAPLPGNQFTETGGSWGMTGGDTTHRGLSAWPGLRNGTLAWTFEIDGVITLPARETPDGDILIAAGTVLICLDHDGNQRWRYQAADRITSFEVSPSGLNEVVCASGVSHLVFADGTAKGTTRLAKNAHGSRGLIPPEHTHGTAAGETFDLPLNFTADGEFTTIKNDRILLTGSAMHADRKLPPGVHCLSPDFQVIWSYISGTGSVGNLAVNSEGVIAYCNGPALSLVSSLGTECVQVCIEPDMRFSPWADMLGNSPVTAIGNTFLTANYSNDLRNYSSEGDLLWQADTSLETFHTHAICATPERSYLSSHDTIQVLDNQGNLLHSVTLERPVFGGVTSAGNGGFQVADEGDNLYHFGADGSEISKVSLGPGWSRPFIVNLWESGMLIRTNRQLLLRSETGDITLNLVASGAAFSPPAYHPDSMIITALSPAMSCPAGSFMIPEPEIRITEKMEDLDLTRGVIALDLTGREVWRNTDVGDVFHQPIIGRRNRIFVLNTDNEIVCLESDGTERWRQNLNEYAAGTHTEIQAWAPLPSGQLAVAFDNRMVGIGK